MPVNIKRIGNEVVLELRYKNGEEMDPREELVAALMWWINERDSAKIEQVPIDPKQVLYTLKIMGISAWMAECVINDHLFVEMPRIIKTFENGKPRLTIAKGPHKGESILWDKEEDE